MKLDIKVLVPLFQKRRKFSPSLFQIFSSILCLITCQALYRLNHQTKDGIKVFAQPFSKFFSSILCLLTCRALYRLNHQTKDGIKVFAQPFSKGWLTL